jgi:tetraacyldisaccharide 4'-kinase
MKLIMWPLSIIYSWVMRLRNYFYDSGFFKTYYFDVPIVSLGNVTVGGTGKTPILCELVSWAQDKGYRPAIVSRGYKSKVKDWARVPVDGLASEFGDEPTMMASRFKDVPVYIGANRVSVVQNLLKNEKVNIIFADDAFQHRRLGRNIDIVILDATDPLVNYRVLPLGRAREDLSGLSRADVVILSRVNLVSPNEKQKMLDFIEQHRKNPSPVVIECEYYITEICSLMDGKTEKMLRQDGVALLSGIGNPKSFEQLAKMNCEVKYHFQFDDHHEYTTEDIEKVISAAKKMGVKKILLTEKDAVKIRVLKVDQSLFWATKLMPKLSLKIKELYEKLAKLNH